RRQDRRAARYDTWSGDDLDPAKHGPGVAIGREERSQSGAHSPASQVQVSAARSPMPGTGAEDLLALLLAGNLSSRGNGFGAGAPVRGNESGAPERLARGGEAGWTTSASGGRGELVRSVQGPAAAPSLSELGLTPPAAPEASRPGESAARRPEKPTAQEIRERLDKQPLAFEANQGQAEAPVQFVAHGRSYFVSLAPTEAV